MWQLWRGRSKEGESAEVLLDAPLRPRKKTYSAATGYIYEYLFRGYRLSGRPGAREYVFQITRDRVRQSAVSVKLSPTAVRACEASIGRALLDIEQYAIAKLALFDAFDNVADVSTIAMPLQPVASQMEAHLRHLGRL